MHIYTQHRTYSDTCLLTCQQDQSGSNVNYRYVLLQIQKIPSSPGSVGSLGLKLKSLILLPHENFLLCGDINAACMGRFKIAEGIAELLKRQCVTSRI